MSPGITSNLDSCIGIWIYGITFKACHISPATCVDIEPHGVTAHVYRTTPGDRLAKSRDDTEPLTCIG
ncbi:hypothetical protein N1E44_31845, partial [Pseudomonas aeruginosa]|nr:hypothetical protein [Pseudomonas aeruginosa]MCS9531781.1 hypothetical protein [Pseudomonas aeruginosa]MCS9587679.1 hypothetical protein [Pseudomonas aeruginosa]MCS9624671.1 hypothetical protein [Pseudomonas aeruginosa]MCS9630968.1 hypothetical protein [Pseudomonas aeruginosa]